MKKISDYFSAENVSESFINSCPACYRFFIKMDFIFTIIFILSIFFNSLTGGIFLKDVKIFDYQRINSDIRFLEYFNLEFAVTYKSSYVAFCIISLLYVISGLILIINSKKIFMKYYIKEYIMILISSIFLLSGLIYFIAFYKVENGSWFQYGVRGWREFFPVPPNYISYIYLYVIFFTIVRSVVSIIFLASISIIYLKSDESQ